jgi:hypothetical protein
MWKSAWKPWRQTVVDLTPGDEAVLAAWRAWRRHNQGEGPAPTERQRDILADPGFAARVEAAQRRAGWPCRSREIRA